MKIKVKIIKATKHSPFTESLKCDDLKRGDVLDFPENVALNLIAIGIAKAVVDVKTKKKPATKKTAVKKES